MTTSHTSDEEAIATWRRAASVYPDPVLVHIEYVDSLELRSVIVHRPYDVTPADVGATWLFLAISTVEGTYDVWGYTPLVLATRGPVTRDLFVDTPTVRCKDLAGCYVGLLQGGSEITFDPSLFASEFNADQAADAIRMRLGGVKEAASASPEMAVLGYWLVLLSVVYQGRNLFDSGTKHFEAEWHKMETTHASHQLAWHGGHNRLVSKAFGSVDNVASTSGHVPTGQSVGSIDSGYSQGRMLTEHSIQVMERTSWNCFDLFQDGMATAVNSSWHKCILGWLGRVNTVHLNLAHGWFETQQVVAGEKEMPWLRHDHWMPRLLQRTHQLLWSRSRVGLTPRDRVVGAGAKQESGIGIASDLSSLVASMPPCIQRLHQRAVGECGLKDHLRYEERRTYAGFMMGIGVNVDSYVDMQRDFTIRRLGEREGRRALRVDIESYAIQTLDWLSKRTKRGLAVHGQSCRDVMVQHGHIACPFYDVGESGFGSTLMQQQNKAYASCRRARAAVLGETVTTKPEGSPLGFALTMRTALSQRHTNT